MAIPECHPYPESEEVFGVWMARAAEVGAVVTKLAFMASDSLPPGSLPPEPVMVSGDMRQIMDAMWSEEVANSRVPFLRQLRALTAGGGEYWRFYATSNGERPSGMQGMLPDIHSTYVGWLMAHLASYNGPYGGEQSHLLSADLAWTTGMLSLPYELQVAQRRSDGELLSAIAVGYEEGSAAVAFRKVYSSDHKLARQAAEVVYGTRWILENESHRARYRIPWVRPPEHIRELLGKHGLQPHADGPYLKHGPRVLTDLLPPIFQPE